jgi:hypothetical protein
MSRCRVCPLSRMEQHPELIWWSKCPTCGYTAIVMNDLSIENQFKVTLNPYARYDGRVVAPPQQETPKKEGLPVDPTSSPKK